MTLYGAEGLCALVAGDFRTGRLEYNNTRRTKTKLKGLTPVRYRNQALQTA
ncbi:IS3 family transposase [Morganella morganii]|nr:IS3 family transposase [Morganella morganii]